MQKILLAGSGGKRPVGRSRHRWEDNVIRVRDRELWYVLVPATLRLDILADCCE
jgi:hypothetical protein